MICSDAAQTPGSPVAMNTAPSDERWGVFLDPRGASQHRLGVRCKPTDADEGRERMIDEKPGVTSSGLAEPSGLSIQVIEVVDGRYVEFAHDRGDQTDSKPHDLRLTRPCDPPPGGSRPSRSGSRRQNDRAS